MTERRITSFDKAENSGDRLKHIAGLMQKLSYREMKELAELVACRCPNEGPDTVVEALLNAADAILAPPAPRAGVRSPNVF